MKTHYPPPYLRDVCHCQDANTDLFKRATDIFNWSRAIVNGNINEKVSILNKTVLDILSDFIPHERLSIDE